MGLLIHVILRALQLGAALTATLLKAPHPPLPEHVYKSPLIPAKAKAGIKVLTMFRTLSTQLAPMRSSPC